MLIGLIAFAMVAFLFMDVFSNNFGGGGPQQQGLGIVEGVELDERTFNDRLEEATNNYRASSPDARVDETTRNEIRQSVWDAMVQEVLSEKEYEEIGLSVGTEEMLSMITGTEPHPMIRQAFSDPNTGEFNSANVVGFIRNLDQFDETQQNAWFQIEKTIKQDRLAQKYLSMVSKGLSNTTAEAKEAYLAQNKKADVDFVLLEYFEIPDSTITVSESELNEYYKENKESFLQDESAKLEYVVFDVIPTPEDSILVLQEATSLIDGFKESNSRMDYADLNSDIKVDKSYVAEEEYESVVADTLLGLDTGIVIGPYIEEGFYKASCIMDKKPWPDSVRARHILISSANDAAGAEATIDSIIDQLNAGVPFEFLAQRSDDASNKDKGGDLGYFAEGMMVQAFNDSAFNGEVGKIMKVATQFGFHAVEVTDKKDFKPSVQVATLAVEIVPSDGTFNTIYQIANVFQGENRTYESFENSINEGGLNKRIEESLTKDALSITGITDSRQIIRWIFRDAKEKDVSDVFTCGSSYVVAALAQMRKEGTAPLEYVKDQIASDLAREKKAEMLANRLREARSSSTDLESIATAVGSTLRPVTDMSFGASFISGIGSEPALVGQIYRSTEGSIQGPVEGSRGVYLFQVNKFTEPEDIGDYTMQKTQSEYFMQSRVQSELFDVLKNRSKIEDNRFLFY